MSRDETIDWLMFTVVGWPRDRAMRSPNRAMRLLLMVVQLVWFFPAMIAAMIASVAIGLFDEVAEFWNGNGASDTRP